MAISSSNNLDLTHVPLVCICIPTYNVSGTVYATLKSILAQTYPYFIVHISDNASTDDTLNVINSILDPRLIVHQNSSNIGGEENFNRCIQLGEGKYTAIFHADDIYEPEMIARQVAFLESHPDAGAVFTKANLIDESGQLIGSLGLPKSLLSIDGVYSFSTIFKSVLQYSNFLICPSAMVRTEIYQKEIQSWRGCEFGTSSDLDVWFRILQHHNIGVLNEPLIRYRISRNQHSALLRSRIIRSDLFLVLDRYINQSEVQAFLSSEDKLNFTRLERTDRLVRAANFYLLGRENEARLLCADIFSVDAFQAALHDRRGLATFALGLFLHFFIFFHLSVIGKPLLLRLKYYARK